MNETRKESFRKWATFGVSTLALLIACLRDPIVFTLKGTAHEALREEFARRDNVSASEATRDRRRDSDSEILKRLDQVVEALREKTAAKESDQKLLVEMSNRLLALQTRLDLMTRERQREK